MSPSAIQLPTEILIIGGGLGGLALGQGLKKASIPFHIFERDPSADFRPQGYRIKINGEGAAALKQILTPELWTYFEETCAESKPGETNFNAISGAITHSRAGPGLRGGPTPYLADRTVLRDLLREGLEGHISYGKTFSHYETEEGGDGVTATFTDGTTYTGVMVVGADGVRSGVRKQFLPEHKIVDTNGRCIYGKTPMTEELIQRFPARATKWMTLIVDQTPMTQTLDIDETPLTLLLEPVRFPTTSSAHRSKLPQNYVYWVLIGRADLFGKPDSELLKLNDVESAELSLKLTSEWDPAVRSLFELQDVSQSSTLRVSSAKPAIPFWDPSARVTLLGDAVHAMSPCGGVGAVTALHDAAVLSARLSETGGVCARAVGAYEAEMRGYAKLNISRSYFGGKKMFGQRPFGALSPSPSAVPTMPISSSPSFITTSLLRSTTTRSLSCLTHPLPSLYFDATNISKKSRRRRLRLLRKIGTLLGKTKRWSRLLIEMVLHMFEGLAYGEFMGWEQWVAEEESGSESDGSFKGEKEKFE